jgi:apolipoprotein N-acyltransferase
VPPKLRDWYRSPLGHSLVGAALLWAALPPVDLWPLAFVAPAWWVLLIRREQLGGKRPYGAIWLAGLAFWLAALYWLTLADPLTILGWLGLGIYLAFYLPVFIGLSRVAVHRLRVPVALASPVVWTGLELLRGHLLSGFTMASLGHAMYRWLALIQISDLAGAYGVSFVVMLVAASLGRMAPLEGRRWVIWPLGPAAVAVAAVLVYGHVRLSDPPEGEPAARVALVQGSIDITLRPKKGQRTEMHQQYVRLSLEAVERYGADRIDLVVWPESVFGATYVTYDPGMPVPAQWPDSPEEFRQELSQADAATRRALASLAAALDSPLLVGIDRQHFGASEVRFYNSAVHVLGSGEVAGCYDKMHLVAFGEYVPLADKLSWLVELTPLNTLGTGLDTGSRPEAFECRGLLLSPNICYETVIPHLIRRQVNTLARQGREPDVLVNLTNDGWFWGSAELDMHLVCGVFRAVECRKPLLIAANTGFSAHVDGDGRILRQGPRRATDVLLAEVYPDPRGSWYLRWGDWPAGVCLGACGVLAIAGAWTRWRGGLRPSTGRVAR